MKVIDDKIKKISKKIEERYKEINKRGNENIRKSFQEF